MKTGLWLLLGLVVGGGAGWYAREHTQPEVRTHQKFLLLDDPHSLSARGSWRSAEPLATKINTVKIFCLTAEKYCDLYQADVVAMGDQRWLTLHSGIFTITKLDAQSMVAEERPDGCMRRTLTFDRVAKAVMLVRTKISRDAACMMQDEPLSLYLGEPLR